MKVADQNELLVLIRLPPGNGEPGKTPVTGGTTASKTLTSSLQTSVPSL